MKINDEIWQQSGIVEGMLVSSLGRVQLPSRSARMPHGGLRYYYPKPTVGTKQKASKTARHQYMGMFNRTYGSLKIHRLVCEAFYGPPPNEKSVVIHIDENALNNKSSNLKWGTQKENLNMPKFIKYCKSRTGEQSPMRKYINSLTS